jgi:antimicrobial peptide system SdpA family protein
MPNERLNVKWTPRQLGLFALALGGGWLIVFVYAVHAALPFNPIQLPFENEVQVRMWMPEGWAFFTKDPRGEVMFLFANRDGKWISALMGPNAKFSNVFGLNRASRIQGAEAGALANKFPKSALRDCRDSPAVCLEHIATAGSIKNASPNPSLCGEIGIVLQEPLPWAWWASGHAVVMPSRILRINVSCHDQ